MTTTTRLPRRQLLLLLGIAAVVAAVVLGVFATVSPPQSMSAKCPAGESEDLFTGMCVPELSPAIVQMTAQDFGEAPAVDGVPCTGHNSYECIGLAEESQGAGPTPSATSELTAQTETPTSSGAPSSTAPPAPPTGQDVTLAPDTTAPGA
ncbi:MAG: intersectin-EH binding protein Ibp1 [Jiangellaceae bacterium]